MIVPGGELSGTELHLDYSFNCFNDVDMTCYKHLPILSPELSLNEAADMKNKNFIVLVHGDIVLMTTKQNIKAPEICDEEERKFNIRKGENYTEILNSKQLGLFNKTTNYLDKGIKYFYIDISKDVGKYVRIYRKIIDGNKFDDSKIIKGFTTGRFSSPVL